MNKWELQKEAERLRVERGLAWQKMRDATIKLDAAQRERDDALEILETIDNEMRELLKHPEWDTVWT